MPDKNSKSIRTSVTTLCIKDYIRVSGQWEQVMNLYTDGDDCIVGISRGIIEFNSNSMVEIAA